MADVVIDWDETHAERLVVVKISNPGWELNVRAAAADFARLERIREADWEKRGSLPIGEAAGAAAFWSFRAGRVTVVVGLDDELWDVAVEFSVEAVDELLVQLARLGD